MQIYFPWHVGKGWMKRVSHTFSTNVAFLSFRTWGTYFLRSFLHGGSLIHENPVKHETVYQVEYVLNLLRAFFYVPGNFLKHREFGRKALFYLWSFSAILEKEILERVLKFFTKMLKVSKRVPISRCWSRWSIIYMWVFNILQHF